MDKIKTTLHFLTKVCKHPYNLSVINNILLINNIYQNLFHITLLHFF